LANRISAIIPAYNEGDLVGETVRATLNIPGVTEVIVVDDGSTDDTAENACAAGAHRVITLKENRGKGGALNEACPSAEGDIFLLLDADLGSSAGEADKLLEPILRGDADMTIAIFGKLPVEASSSSADGSPKLAARSGGFGTVMKVAKFGIKALTGKRIVAPLSGQRALKREIIEKAGGFAPRFGVEVALTIDALRLGYRIVEVPVAMVHRPSGRDWRGFMHRGRQLLNVMRALSAKAVHR